MLNTDLIVKGPLNNYNLPKNWLIGKYIIECQKKKNPENVLCVDGVTKQILTSGQLINEALKLAHVLKELGVQKGDVVAIVTENHIKFMVIVVAILYIGAVFNPLNPGYSKGELKHAFNMSKSKIVFCSQMALINIKETSDELGFINRIILIEKINATQQYVDVDTLESLLETTVIDPDYVTPAEFDTSAHTAMLLLSSGTTGLPKGVMITHDNFRQLMGYLGDPNLIGILPEDVGIGVLPFFHILGLSSVFSAAVYSTKLIVLSLFQPEIFLKCIQDHKPTITNLVPPIISFLAKHPIVKKFDISSLRILFCSGGYLGREIQEEFYKVHPSIRILLAYGITEMTGACTIVNPGGANEHDGVGRIIPNTEGIIWSKELGTNLKALDTGELCFKGPSVMKGYIGKESNDVDEYGFYHTGDIGYYDKEGCFYIVGRIKELIKYKGFQVAPAELEDLILKHPAVKECGVIGIPDERAGQLPTALIVRQGDTKVTAEEIITFVAERISVQKHLYGGVYFVDVIPRNAAGKILRDKLMDIYKAL